MPGLDAVAGYLPRYRISGDAYREAWGRFAARAIRNKAVPGFDEDETTMAVEAASRLPTLPRVDAIFFASSSGGACSGTIAEALGRRDVFLADVLGTTDAGGVALRNALDFVAAHGGRALVVTADAPVGEASNPSEHGRGAGAAALTVSAKGAWTLRSTGAASGDARGADVAGRLRSAGRAAGVAKSDHVFAADGDPRWPDKAFADLVGRGRILRGLAAEAGDCGASAAFLNLAENSPAILRGYALLATAGGGSANALRFRVARPLRSGPPPAGSPHVEIDYVRYAQLRRFLSDRTPSVSQGAYVSPTAYRASLGARYRLEGQRCAKCGEVQFPPREACKACGSTRLRVRALRREGVVHAFTIIGRGAAPSEFAEQQRLTGEYATAIVDLADGPRTTGQLTDVEPREVSIGDPVEAVFRRIYEQEGVVRYGLKFRPSGTRLGSARRQKGGRRVTHRSSSPSRRGSAVRRGPTRTRP